jgi:hypothetical protein
MRTNGTIWYQKDSDNAINDDGEPNPCGNIVWSDAIPCSVKTVTNSNQGVYSDGKFTQYSYEILVESIPMNIQRVKLMRNGIDLGEFPIQGLPIPTTMSRIKIVV